MKLYYKEVTATCELCGTVQEVIWKQYGSEDSCAICNAAPIFLVA